MVTNPTHRVAVKELEDRVASATQGPRLAETSNPQSLFVGWGVETAASLINHIIQRSDGSEPVRLVDEAWRELAAVASVDGMLRATELSNLSQDEEQTQES